MDFRWSFTRIRARQASTLFSCLFTAGVQEQDLGFEAVLEDVMQVFLRVDKHFPAGGADHHDIPSHTVVILQPSNGSLSQRIPFREE